jgi:hypothetical protein
MGSANPPFAGSRPHICVMNLRDEIQADRTPLLAIFPHLPKPVLQIRYSRRTFADYSACSTCLIRATGLMAPTIACAAPAPRGQLLNGGDKDD